MTESFETVALCRPRVKQDVLFTETPYGVLFHNADAGFQLAAKSAYPLARVLVPHLNGANTVADLCAGLGDGPRRMVAELVSAMLARGFARDVAGDGSAVEACPPEVRERFQTQINYVDHFVDRPEARFAAFRATRIAVLGKDPVASWCLLSLVRNGAAALAGQASPDPGRHPDRELDVELAALRAAGAPVELARVGRPGASVTWSDLAGYDVVVVAGGPTGNRQLMDLLFSGVPDGVALLSASAFGDRVLVGPLMTAERRGCWLCAVLRFSANDRSGVAADVLSGLHAPRAEGAALSRPLAAMIGNLLAYEVFRIRTGALPAETDGQVIIQDLDSLDVVTEPLLAHPDCPRCATAADPGFGDAVPTMPAVPIASSVAVVEDGDPMLGELNLAGTLVRPTVGVFTRFADEECTQLPLKVGRLALGVGHRRRRVMSAFDVHHVLGARRSALHRAAEVYAEHVLPLPVSTDDDPTPRIDPAELAIASGLPAPAGAVEAWTAARSLRSGRQVLVPAAAVHTFGAYNTAGLFVATSAGTGAGGSPGEALGRGLLGALGYAALTRAVRGTQAAARVPLDALEPDAELKFLVSSAGNLDVGLEVLDLPTPAGYAVLARAVDPAGGAPLWALGSAVAWQRAALDAIRDLLGGVQLRRELDTNDELDTGDPVLRALEPFTLAVDGRHAVDLAAETGWPALLDTLYGAGRDVLTVPIAAPDLARGGVWVARTLLLGRD